MKGQCPSPSVRGMPLCSIPDLHPGTVAVLPIQAPSPPGCPASWEDITNVSRANGTWSCAIRGHLVLCPGLLHSQQLHLAKPSQRCPCGPHTCCAFLHSLALHSLASLDPWPLLPPSLSDPPLASTLRTDLWAGILVLLSPAYPSCHLLVLCSCCLSWPTLETSAAPTFPGPLGPQMPEGAM